MREVEEGGRFETVIGIRRRGTVKRIWVEGATLLVDAAFDQLFNGKTERTVLYIDLRPLSLLELIAEAAADVPPG